MKSFFVNSMCLVLCSPLFCQEGEILDFDIYIDQIKNYNFSQVEKFLEEGREKYKQNPEYYVLLLNYVSFKGNPSRIILSSGEPQEGDFELQDIENGNTMGFLGKERVKDVPLIVNGLKRTQHALSFFNSRLDIHFGVVYIAETIEKWDIVGEQLVEILETSVENQNQWTWGKVNSMEGDPEEFMLNNVLAKTAEMFEIASPEAENAFIGVSKAIIKYYPEKVYGYANLGVHYLVKNQLDPAKEYLEKANRIDPKDEIVLGNLQRLNDLQAK